MNKEETRGPMEKEDQEDEETKKEEPEKTRRTGYLGPQEVVISIVSELFVMSMKFLLLI